MKNFRVVLAALALLASIACAAADEAAAPNDTEAPAGASSAADEPLRTGNPAARGFTEADFPRLTELADGVYAYEQLTPGAEQIATISLIVVTDEGVLVADGQGSVEETQLMIGEIGKLTDQPITHVVICSDHGDHTAGNSAFPDSAVFYAHPTSAATLETSANRPRRSENAPPVVLPDELVMSERVVELGGTEIQILFLGRAHTGGDLSVYLPAEKILFMSEAYMNRLFPPMRSAYPSEWVAMIERAQALDVDIYVPGHGFVDYSPEVLEEELENYRQAVAAVVAEGTRLHAAGLSADEAVDQAQFGEFEEWWLRASQGERALRRVYMEINGELPNQ